MPHIINEDDDEGAHLGAEAFVERRHHLPDIRQERTWRTFAKDILLAGGLLAGLLSAAGFFIGPMLGKRLVDDSTVLINASSARIIIHDSVLTVHDREIHELQDSMAEESRRSNGSIYLQCQMYDMLAPRAPRPQVCAGVPRFR